MKKTSLIKLILIKKITSLINPTLNGNKIEIKDIYKIFPFNESEHSLNGNIGFFELELSPSFTQLGPHPLHNKVG